MWLAKPFFSWSTWLGGLGWPWSGPGPAVEEEDERLTNRFMSMVLWKQEQAHFGSSKQVQRRSLAAITIYAPFLNKTTHSLNASLKTITAVYAAINANCNSLVTKKLCNIQNGKRNGAK